MPKKLNDRLRKKIAADYAECENYSEVARKYKIAVNSVKNVINADEKFASLCNQKKEQNTADILEELDSRKDIVIDFFDETLQRMFELAKTSKDIKGIATALGIVIDKQMLKKNYELKKWELELRQREVELKEKERNHNGNFDNGILNELSEYLKRDKNT